MHSKITANEFTIKKFNTTEQLTFTNNQLAIQKIEKQLKKLQNDKSKESIVKQLLLRNKIHTLGIQKRTNSRLISELKLLAAHHAGTSQLRHPNLDQLIKKYDNLNKDDFLFMLPVSPLTDYIDDLSNRYYFYIFLEIVEEYNLHKQVEEKTPQIKDKNKRNTKYMNALNTLKELNDYYSENIENSLIEIEEIISEFISISRAEYEKVFKKTILEKLENYGLSHTKAKQFYTDLAKDCN